MTRYINIGVAPLDDLNKEARKLLKRTRADAVMIITLGEGLDIAAAGRRERLTPAEMVGNLRAAADKLERETGAQ